MNTTKPRSRMRLWALLLALAMVAAACTGDAEPDETEDGDTPTETEAPDTPDEGEEPDEEPDTGEEPSSGETLVHAADDEPLSLDPAGVEPGESGETVIYQVYERLVEIAPDGPDLIPGLATEVPSEDNGLISEDGLTYTFPIREGVTFHDGSELTAEDVKYSWDRALEMGLPEGNSGIFETNIAETTVVDDYTFEVSLNERNAAFLNSVVPLPVASIVSQETVEANGGVEANATNEFMASNPIGTGSYAFEAWNRNENLQFSVYEDYWGTPANLDLRFEIVQDPDVRVLGLRAGDYDTVEANPSLIPNLEGAEGIVIYEGEYQLEPQHMGMNLNIDPELLPPEDTIPADFFHDPRIRQAFNYVFDYEGFINGGYGGFGTTVPHYFPQGILGYSEDYAVYEQDLARAEELFREAGYWEEGFTLSIITEGQNLFETSSLVLRDSLAQLNPLFELRVLAIAEAQFDEAHASTPVPYAMWSKNADPYGDPHAFLWDYIHPDGPWGEQHGFRNGYQDPDTIADLIDAGAVETSADERVAIYNELQPLIHEDPMWLIPGNESVLGTYREEVQNFVMNPLYPRPSIKFSLLDK